MKTLFRILAVLGLGVSAFATTPVAYAPATLATSCNAVTSAVGLCTPLYLPGNSLAVGVTWQLTYDTGTANAISVTLVGSNDNVNWANVLDTNATCVTNGAGCSQSLIVISYKYLACNVGTYTLGTTNDVTCQLTVNPDAAAATNAGDSLTSPNSTINIGGSQTATTVDVAGAAGEIMAGATPALTYTPGVGVDNSHAGAWTFANGSANAHTTVGSAATTSNTWLWPAVVLPTGTVAKCSTSSTTCTVAPSSIVDNGTKIVVTEPIQSASVAFASLPTPAAGMEIYCSDCQVTTAATCSTVSPGDCVCKGSGTGAFAKYMNYQANGAGWYCQ